MIKKRYFYFILLTLITNSLHGIKVILKTISLQHDKLVRLSFLKNKAYYEFHPTNDKNIYTYDIGIDVPCEFCIKDSEAREWIRYRCNFFCNPTFGMSLSLWMVSSSKGVSASKKQIIPLQFFSPEELRNYREKCYYELHVFIENFSIHSNVQFNPEFVKALAYTQKAKNQANIVALKSSE